jgi:hypothetical protein
MRNIFLEQGYIVYKNFLNKDFIEEYRNILDNYLETHNSFHEDTTSKIIPGFAGITPELKELNNLHENAKLLDLLKTIFDNETLVFLDHSDLHQNKTTGWHRDTGDYIRGGGNIQNIWQKDCLIIKISFLLQDHLDNTYGLWFNPGSHIENIKNQEVHAYTESTDLIIFDQRILHRGQVSKPSYKDIYKKNRYLITYAFGLDNDHSKIHMLGATKRQNQQRSKMI